MPTLYIHIYISIRYVITKNIFAMGAGRGRKASQAFPPEIFLKIHKKF
jgi:hypothetical protein